MIEIKNLHYKYNENDLALNGIDLTINDYEWVAILGHNGSGKSTLSKLLVGLLAPTKGEIFCDGIKLEASSVQEIRKKIGIVFQNPDNQFVGVNVRYDVAFGLENRLVEREVMEKLILDWTKEVGMADYLLREPNTLSGGQKQRVAIAGILALNTDYIILDEATSMLDPDGVKDITALIKSLKEKYNKTIITITHDLDLAKLADRVVVLKEGKIIAEGEPDAVFKLKDVLRSSNLDVPFAMKMYDLVRDDATLSRNQKLEEALWEYHLKK